MKQIIKKAEPVKLTQYRLQSDAVYDGPNFTVVKNDIRTSLLEEQGYLCAYCMKRISFHNMKVEHWAPQETHPDKQLNYRNLLGCCKGNEGFPPSEQTCDTKKANLNLSFSPADSSCSIESKVIFANDGLVFSTDQKFDRELNDILNLNYYRLKRNREEKLEGLKRVLNRDAGRRTKSQLQALISRYSSLDTNGMYREYAAVILGDLKKRYARAPR
ncbi:retron system putative HNH endonuclease [Vibrio sp. 16]|uniref:retron system putative HNH endonuclease n=1 Tax=Vibrio sp. 16 TaxID=391586 RepID=UPI00018F3141|nr:retron system putative HNH endonuclease [Vibrio sp. 16]EED26341.1 conserved hypothetical protein [Vibrio sp. 16]CAK4075904.1 hypothetical protein VDT1_4288 [Vibrio sp. 16]